MKQNDLVNRAYDLMTGDEDARVCRDIPDSACHDQPRNFFAYLVANLFNKIADELASAKLTLPWLLGAVGAPAIFTGFLVPIREAGALLPQLVVAAVIRHLPRRKIVWLLGAALSAISLLVMAAAVTSLSGAAAGWAVVLLLVMFSLARGLCSVSAKDVLGKTISKGRRGSLMGYSAGIAGIVTLGFGFYIQWFMADSPTTSLMAGLLLISAGLWILALFSFASIIEQPGATEGGGNALTTALHSLKLIQSDVSFRQFVVTRLLLLSVALSPPFYVLLAQQHASGGLTGLGMLIIASGIASSVSAPLWGRLGDRSSRLVMLLAALAAGLLGISVFLFVKFDTVLLDHPLFHATLFLGLTIFHSGVRLGRKVYLVDMASAETRATYVALSNTIIGIAMLLGGVIGVIADLLNTHTLILILALVSLAASLYAWRLPEVSH
jgi:hypothetical protein